MAGDINLSANFNTQVKKPLDDRLYVANITERNNLGLTQRFLFMEVVTTDTGDKYRLINDPATSTTSNSDWLLVGNSSSGSVNLGTNGQIPFMNVAGDNFSYDNSLIRHNTTGNIGINSPIDFGYKLDVGGNIRLADGGYLSGTVTGSEKITFSSVNGMSFNIGGSERMRVNTVGDFLIGTTTYDVLDRFTVFQSPGSTERGIRVEKHGFPNARAGGMFSALYKGFGDTTPTPGDNVSSFSFYSAGTSGLDSNIPSFSIMHTIGSLQGYSLSAVDTSFMVNTTVTGVQFPAITLQGQTGNVGVGTPNPNKKLEVNGAARFQDGIGDNSMIMIGATTSLTNERLIISPSLIRYNEHSSSFLISGDNLDYGGRIRLYGRNDATYPGAVSIFSGSSVNNVIHMSDAGKLSVGFMSGSFKFNVLDRTATFVAQFRGSNSTYVVSGDSSLGGESGYTIRNTGGETFIAQLSSGDFGIITTGGAKDIYFSTWSIEAMRIKSASRNVLIGTTTDSGHKLVSTTGSLGRVAMFGNIEITNGTSPSWTGQGFRCDGANQPIQYVAVQGGHAFYTVVSTNKVFEIEPTQGNTIVGGGTNNGSKLQVNGSIAKKNRVTTTNTTFDSSDYRITANAISNAIDVTLPDATTCVNREYVLKTKNNLTNLVRVLTTLGQTIDDAAAPLNMGVYQSLTFYSDGFNRYIS